MTSRHSPAIRCGGRWRSLGLALAGFGLIFVGIETLQNGMQGLSGVFKLSELPSSGFLSHVMMMLVGAAMTIIMQSSSAAMATTLTALHTDSINFEPAASIVIGAEKKPTLTRHLDPTVLNIPAVALEATRRALDDMACEMFRDLRSSLTGRREARDESRSAELHQALTHAQEFFAEIPPVALNMLDTMRWLERVSYHAWRICHYLGGDGAPETAAAAVEMHPSAGASVPT